MKTAHFEYKCRRCGEIEKNPHCADSKAIFHLMNAMTNSPREPFAPSMLEMHICNDGGNGIADLIGCSFTEG